MVPAAATSPRRALKGGPAAPLAVAAAPLLPAPEGAHALADTLFSPGVATPGHTYTSIFKVRVNS